MSQKVEVYCPEMKLSGVNDENNASCRSELLLLNQKGTMLNSIPYALWNYVIKTKFMIDHVNIQLILLYSKTTKLIPKLGVCKY